MVQKTSPFTGWYIKDGQAVTGFIPYSASFDYNGIRYFATTSDSAKSIAKMIIADQREAEKSFFKSHPELNP